MNGTQIGLDWLYTTLVAMPTLGALIGTGADARAYEAGKVPKPEPFPYLTVDVVDQQIATPIGGMPNAWNTVVDLSLWDQSTDDTALISANDEIESILSDHEPVMHLSKQVSCGMLMPLPPAPPPKQPGEPTTVRLGAMYEIFVGAA